MAGSNVCLRVRQNLSFVLVALAVVCLASTDPAAAYKVGEWESTCMATNTITGELQAVKEAQVSVRPLHPWFARTSRMPDGTWQTDYNVYVMLASKLSDDARKFIFYHECAHARLNEASERKADCEGLKQMRAEVGVSQQAIKDISYSYLLILRMFPTGGPCDDKALQRNLTTKNDE